MDWLFAPILKLIWSIFVQLLLKLLDVFTEVMDFLGAGIIRDLIFSNGEFDVTKLPLPFIVFGGLAVLLMIIFFITNYIAAMVNDDSNIKEKMFTSLKHSFKGTLYILMIPIMLFVGFAGIIMIQGIIGHAFNIGDFSFGKLIWLIGDYKNTNWGNIDFSLVPPNFSAPSGLDGSGLLAAILGIICALYLTVTLGFSMGQKLFEMYLLFVISPIYAASTVHDGGERFKGWCSGIFGRLLTIISIRLMFAIFAVVMMPILKIAGENTNPLVTITIILFGMGGGALFCEGGMKLVARLISEGAGQDAADSSNQASRMAGRMVLGAAVGVGIGVAKMNKPRASVGAKVKIKISKTEGKSDKKSSESSRNARMGGDNSSADKFTSSPIKKPNVEKGNSPKINGKTAKNDSKAKEKNLEKKGKKTDKNDSKIRNDQKNKSNSTKDKNRQDSSKNKINGGKTQKNTNQNKDKGKK
ncbi:Mbov_0396 family ICE element transmembrane protein [Williamsoniiplasma luminosum]|uniref:Uncharacterized protein n=1 Tax=Williamsoniiplasma luminosum TaxID=214888 RepID=A0A2S0NKG0_9MOLU|nr:hypothetical protein [Williamsoniiplasma luminosum]AVP49494.1 MAG: hypothetical protein C5T88_02865 [Williamsoniiplasma luminosum]